MPVNSQIEEGSGSASVALPGGAFAAQAVVVVDPAGRLPGDTGYVGSANPAYTVPVSGELVGVTVATPLPNIPCRLVRLKAEAANTGKVYVGRAGVTVANGTTNTTSGFQLYPGDDTGWLPLDNLNRLSRICTDTTSHLTYLAVS